MRVYSLDEQDDIEVLYQITGDLETSIKPGQSVRLDSDEKLDAARLFYTSVDPETNDSLVNTILVYRDTAEGLYTFTDGTIEVKSEVLSVPRSGSTGDLQLIKSATDDLIYRFEGGSDNLSTVKSCGLTSTFKSGGQDDGTGYLGRACEPCPERSPFSGGMTSIEC